MRKWIIILIFIALVLFTLFVRDTTVKYRSKIDGNEYDVQDGFDDKHLAADYLAKVNQNIMLLNKYLYKNRNKYTQNQQIAISRLLKLYDPDGLSENTPFNLKGETSFTLKKGDEIVLCLRDKKTGELHKFNSVMFVSLHEIGHVATEEVGHPPIFWKTFKFILREANKIGIIDIKDYSKKSVNYCGLEITHNPLLDPTIEILT